MKLSRSSSNADILAVLNQVADAVAVVLESNTDWGLSGVRHTQYSVDVAADNAALAILHAAGCAVLSEESERTGDFGADTIMVIMDPLDGSTNASRGVQWYATALCAIDQDGPRAALVVNQASGKDRYWATRGDGAFHNGKRMSHSGCTELKQAVVGVSGLASFRPKWAQFRALGAAALDKFLPMLTTAAGSIAPAKTFVMGAGVAGLQAIATARRLGAVVSAFDVRGAAGEQVRSLGAQFVDPAAKAEGTGGYARAQTDDETAQNATIIAAHISSQDLVITTALIPGRKAPILVTDAMLATMRPGSVVVDIAAESGGNVEGVVSGETVLKHGVHLIGAANLPASVPLHASQMFATNVRTLITHLTAEDKSLKIDAADEIAGPMLITNAGEPVKR